MSTEGDDDMTAQKDGVATARSYSTGTIHVVHPVNSDDRNTGDFLMVLVAILVTTMSAIALYLYVRKRGKRDNCDVHQEKGASENPASENEGAKEQSDHEDKETIQIHRGFE